MIELWAAAIIDIYTEIIAPMWDCKKTHTKFNPKLASKVEE
jgi:hypothetical protein